MVGRQQYQLEDLLYLMERLRDPRTGCPWDVKQSYRSITSSTIEEAYEVVDAIERDDFVHLKEELGDLLFQVIFYSQLGKEDGYFDFRDVVDSLTEKLIRRHPHVFPDGSLGSITDDAQRLQSDEQVKAQWESIKAEERSREGMASILEDVPLGLPALARAAKLQKRAAKVGFDWSEIAPVIDKIKEEVAELELAYAAGADQDIAEELGDLMFSVVNLSRHLKQDPEHALRQANKKFINRFQHIEQRLHSLGINLEDAEQSLMEQFWIEAKQEDVTGRSPGGD